MLINPCVYMYARESEVLWINRSKINEYVDPLSIYPLHILCYWVWKWAYRKGGVILFFLLQPCLLIKLQTPMMHADMYPTFLRKKWGQWDFFFQESRYKRSPYPPPLAIRTCCISCNNVAILRISQKYQNFKNWRQIVLHEPLKYKLNYLRHYLSNNSRNYARKKLKSTRDMGHCIKLSQAIKIVSPLCLW